MRGADRVLLVVGCFEDVIANEGSVVIGLTLLNKRKCDEDSSIELVCEVGN